MRPLAKVGLVGAGYVGAFAIASAVVTAYVASTSRPDRQNYGAMVDFGDSLLFLAVLGVAAVVPTGTALFFPQAVSRLLARALGQRPRRRDDGPRGALRRPRVVVRDARCRKRLVGPGQSQDPDR